MLLLAALIWGMAFAAQTSASDEIGAFTFNASRSIIAAFFLLAVSRFRNFFKKTPIVKPKKAYFKHMLFGGAICGIILFFAVNFQQFGIAAYPEEAAASGRAGFLTATYVIMVALCTWISGKKLHPNVLIATVVCIIGMSMLCLSDGFYGIYLGDILVLVSAAFFTAYILIIDHFSNLDSINMSCIQFFVCGTLSLIAMFIFEKPNTDALLAAWLPILYTGIFSSGVGYTLQIVGQKYTQPATASIIMSLESVFAALAGWFILKECLNESELIGCALVFFAVILAQIPGLKKKQTQL